MAERPEDLNLPTSIVTRIIKDCLPASCKVSKEANAAIAKVNELDLASLVFGFSVSFNKRRVHTKKIKKMNFPSGGGHKFHFFFIYGVFF